GFRAGGPVRPVFFAGQLLTEDDLGALATWTAGRVRSHNRLRYVSPEGLGAVLCGLSVDCGTCAPGVVRIGPGHAVDGAGNDIPVACAEDVDVVALAREYRASGGGCQDDEPCPPGPERVYGLFLRHEEEFAEPAAPYDPGDGCTPAGCVPTRVREGHRYLVRRVPDAQASRLCALLRRRFDDRRAFLESCLGEVRPSSQELTEWLTARLDVNGDLCDRAPRELLCEVPVRQPGNDVRLNRLRKDSAWRAFEAYLRAAVRSLLVVPCPDGCAPDVLIAVVTLDGCDVVRAVPAGRRGTHLPDPAEAQWRPRLAELVERDAGTPELLTFVLDLLDVTGCQPSRDHT
ncbi:hypothetical protein ACWD25_34975, partial [Streptomyces sp. NPDC002920]